MSDRAYAQFVQRMMFEGPLPVRFEAAAPAGGGQLRLLAERNARLLGAIELLEERRAEHERDRLDDATAQELARMDAKLNLLIEIVTHALAPAHGLPQRQRVRFNAVGAEVPDPLVPDDARHGRLLLSFDACLALPLELDCEVEDGAGAGQRFLRFVHPGETVVEALERFVFRHHRRQLADVRHPGG